MGACLRPKKAANIVQEPKTNGSWLSMDKGIPANVMVRCDLITIKDNNRIKHTVHPRFVIEETHL